MRHLHVCVLLPIEVVPLTLLPFQTRSTWAYPIHYRPALVFAILSVPLPLGRPYGGLAWKPSRRETGGFAMFRIYHGTG